MARVIKWLAVSSQPQLDKISLSEQDRLLQEWCDANGHRVTDTLIVPGHSRSEPDIFTLFDDYAAIGCMSYHRLRDHWRSSPRDFDILAAYDDSRICRSPGGVAMILDCVLKAEARIYRIDGGWIDESNQEFGIAMATIKAPSGIRRLVKMRDAAMDDYAKRGLPTNGSVLSSHKIVRDELGRILKIVVDESHRQLWNDLAALLIAGVSTENLEFELAARGHVDPSGKPHCRNKFYLMLVHPTFWGNSARHFRPGKGKRPSFGLWAMEEGHPIPEGVEIYYNRFEAVWPVGDSLGDQVRAVLRDRASRGSGSSPYSKSRKFAGLLICGQCGYTMVTGSIPKPGARVTRKHALYRCAARRSKLDSIRIACTVRKTINEGVIFAWLDARLRQAITEGLKASDVFSRESEDNLITRCNQIEKDLASADRRIRRAVTRQLDLEDLSDPVHEVYQREIDTGRRQMKTLQADLQQVQQHMAGGQAERQDRDAAWQELLALPSLDEFWKREPMQINLLLRRLFGKLRLVVIDGQIVSMADAPPMHRNRRSRKQIK